MHSQLSAQSTHRTQPLPPLKLTILNCQHTTEGLFAAGIPIGTPMFQGTRAITCADLACQLMEELQALPLADQDRCSWLLLQKSLQQRVAHLPQGCLWQHVGQAAQSAKSKAVDGALLGVAHEDGPLTAQITLSDRHSCLGLPHTGPTNGVAAYPATAATAHRAIHSCPNTFRPCDGPSGAVLSLQWMALHDGAGPLWRPKPQSTLWGRPQQHGYHCRRTNRNIPALRPDPCKRSNRLLRRWPGIGQARPCSPSQLRLPSSFGLVDHPPDLASF
jgi:hypothetical protein